MQDSIDQDRRNFAHIAAWCVLVMLLLKFLISLLNNSLYTWIGHLAVETSAFLMCAILIVEKINRNRKTKAINQILALFNHAPCGFHSLDANGVIIAINQTELDWLGYAYEEVVNKMKLTDLVDAKSLVIFHENFPKLKKYGFINELYVNLVAKDGSLLPVLVSSVAIYDSKGNYHHSLSTLFDITQHKQLEEKLSAAKEAAELASARCRDLYDNAPCGYHSANAEGTIIEINQTLLKWLGYSYEEVVGKINVFDLLPEEIKAEFRSKRQVYIKNGSVNELYFDMIRKDGTRIPILLSAIAVFDEHGNFQHTRATSFDFTNYKELEKDLKAASALIKDLYDFAPCGYQSINKEGVIIEMNQTELDWLGYTYEEVVGKMKLSELVDEETFDLFQELRPEFVRTGKLREIDIDLIRKDGTRLPVLFSSIARYDEHGNFHSSRTTLFDISQRIKLETELRAANKAANLALISQEHFLANMSHEIRTPMNAIIGFTEILEKSELDDRQKQFVKFIHVASENLLNIVNDILDLSKIEAGMFRIETTPFSLLSLLYSIDAMLQVSAAEKNLHMNLQVEPNLPDMLLGDPTRLTQILTNLMGNAIKFTKKGTVDLKVKAVEKFADNIILQFSIKDTGIGITESQLEYIFDRFEQGDKTTSRLYGGTGLGLSICKRLVDLQGGSIHVTSEPGVGSEFVFTLPYKLSDIADVESGFDQVDNPAEPPSPSIPGHGGHILIVEDNLMNRTLIRFLMEEWGYVYDFAENGEIALEKLRTKPFDLVLMDIQMPGMDGYQTTQIIRNELQLTLPIIAMTAHAFPGEREKCLIAGMDDYIAKPLRQAELLALLLQFLKKQEND